MPDLFEDTMKSIEQSLGKTKKKADGLTERFEGFQDEIEEAEEKLESFTEKISLLGKGIDDAGNILLRGKPEELVSNSFQKIDKAASNFTTNLMKMNPALGLVAKALQLGIKWIVGYQKEITETNKLILSSTRSMGFYGESEEQLDKIRRKTYASQVDLMDKLGVGAGEVNKRFQTMIAAGFEPTIENTNKMILAYTLLGKEGLGLSENAILKFNKILKKEFNLGFMESAGLLSQMTETLDLFNISQEERIGVQTELLQSGLKWGLGLKDIQKELDNAQKHTGSWSKAVKQASDMLTHPREMGMEKQLFLAQRLQQRGDLGGQEDMWKAISQVRFGKGTLGDKMMEEVGRMAGLGEVKRGGMREGEAEKFAFFAEKTFGIQRETAEQWALGKKIWKKQNETVKLGEKEINKQKDKMSELNDDYSRARSALSSFVDSIQATTREIFLMVPSRGQREAEAETKKLTIPKGTMREGEFTAPTGKPATSFSEIKHLGGIIGYYNGGVNLAPDDTIVKAKKGEMFLNEEQQLNLFNSIKSGDLGGGENTRDVNINVEGVMFQGLEMYIKNAVTRFFQEKSMGMA